MGMWLTLETRPCPASVRPILPNFLVLGRQFGVSKGFQKFGEAGARRHMGN